MPLSMQMLAPLLGICTAFFLFYSPCPGLRRDRRRGALTTDPLPYPIALISTLIWCLYGAKLNDILVFAPNFVGLGAATFNTTTVLRLCRNERISFRMELILIFGFLSIAAAMMVLWTPLFLEDDSLKLDVIGYMAIAICTIMLASPSIETVKAIYSCDATKLSMPLAIAQVANGLLWTAYGVTRGNSVIIGPNAAGAVLALVTALVKLSIEHHGHAEILESAKDAIPPIGFEDLIQKGGSVMLRSLTFGSFVHVPDVSCPQDGDTPGDADPMTVQSCAEGTVLNITPTCANLIALSTVDGRFLCIRRKASSSVFQPSPFQVAALHCVSPGADAEFLPVCGMFCGFTNLTSSVTPFKQYLKEENITFWNPLYKVFLRLNEAGEMDCSPTWAHPEAVLHGAEPIPSGWGWERFSLIPTADKADHSQLHHRTSVVGKSIPGKLGL